MVLNIAAVVRVNISLQQHQQPVPFVITENIKTNKDLQDHRVQKNAVSANIPMNKVLKQTTIVNYAVVVNGPIKRGFLQTMTVLVVLVDATPFLVKLKLLLLCVLLVLLENIRHQEKDRRLLLCVIMHVLRGNGPTKVVLLQTTIASPAFRVATQILLKMDKHPLQLATTDVQLGNGLHDLVSFLNVNNFVLLENFLSKLVFLPMTNAKADVPLGNFQVWLV